MSALTTCLDCGETVGITADSDPSTMIPCAKCGSTRRNVQLQLPTIDERVSPFAFQWYAKDFYDAYKKVKGGEGFSPARLTLLAQAVELAAKSLHVNQYRCDNDLRKLGHDLVKACDSNILSLYGITLTAAEVTELKKMNDLNKVKAFEYFWFPWQGNSPELGGLSHALTGRSSLPDESAVEGMLNKLLAPNLEV